MIEIYVDGSYSMNSGLGGSAIIAVKNNKNVYQEGVQIRNKILLSSNNIGTECYASVMALRYAINAGYSTLVIYHDYKGISEWVLGKWKAEKPISKYYKEAFISIYKTKPDIQVYFKHVHGHSGVKWNEEVDKLAVSARLNYGNKYAIVL